MKTFEELIDDLDAAVFTGDALVSKNNRELLIEACERWVREAEAMEKSFGYDV